MPTAVLHTLWLQLPELMRLSFSARHQVVFVWFRSRFKEKYLSAKDVEGVYKKVD